MNLEVITTGDEIVSGITLDTNFHWIAGRLTELGFNVGFHTSVGDNRELILNALEVAGKRSSVVIVSGGLGPTPDDLTAEVASLFFGVPLELNKEALYMVEERLREQGRKFLEVNKKQAYLPKGATVLKNLWGTAPGFQFENKGVTFFFLPGVPKEFKAMVEEYVIPYLNKRCPNRDVYRVRTIKTFGLRESEIAERLRGIEREGIKIGFSPSFPEVHIRVVARGKEVDSLISETVNDIASRLGDCVFSTEGENLEEVVGKLLFQRGLTLSVAESCTGGLLAHRITNVPGSSNYFNRGVVVYSNESKVEILGVPEEMILSFGAVSAEVVKAMAEGIRRISNSDLGIAISGIAGPGGGTPEKPVGTVFIGMSHGKGTESKRYLFKGSREEIKILSSETALDWIRKFILNDV